MNINGIVVSGAPYSVTIHPADTLTITYRATGLPGGGFNDIGSGIVVPSSTNWPVSTGPTWTDNGMTGATPWTNKSTTFYCTGFAGSESSAGNAGTTIDNGSTGTPKDKNGLSANEVFSATIVTKSTLATGTYSLTLEAAAEKSGNLVAATGSVSVIVVAAGTPSASRTPTTAATPTPSRTLTPLPLPSSTPTVTSTPLPQASATSSRTPSASASATPSKTSTPTATASRTATDTASPTPTASVTSTFSVSPTISPTFSDSPTVNGTFTVSPTATPSFTDSPTATITPTGTSTATPSDSPTATPSSSATASATPSGTPTATPTDTSTDTPAATASVSPSPTPTFTRSGTATASPTATPTATASPSATPVLSPTPTDILASMQQPALPYSFPAVDKAFVSPNPVSGRSVRLFYFLLGPADGADVRLYTVGYRMIVDLNQGAVTGGWHQANLELPRGLAGQAYFIVIRTVAGVHAFHSKVVSIYVTP